MCPRSVIVMPHLSAKFKLDVSAPCLLQLPDGLTPEMTLVLRGFDVTVGLIPALDRGSKQAGETDWTRVIGQLEVSLSRDEQEPPPDIVVTSDGKRDSTAQAE
jgi:hypothetical protein